VSLSGSITDRFIAWMFYAVHVQKSLE